jgi:hypothetical protein
VLLADLTVWNIFWDILWFFFLFLWILILFNILGDLFRDHETSGVVKALWCIFILFLPFLAVFIYLIARGSGMAQRSAQRATRAQSQFDDYVRSATGGPADQIKQAKDLLDSGAISQAEFDQLKAKALG